MTAETVAAPTTADGAPPATVPASVARAARLYGSRLAYVEGGPASGRALTWAEFAQRVEDLAAGLVALGLNAGDNVAICAENSIDWLLAYHATARAGASAGLVYFEMQPGEIREQVQRGDSRFLFASRHVLQKLGGPVPPVELVIAIGEDGPAPAGALSLSQAAASATAASREALAHRAPSPNDLAAVVYTSGTTAGPKGVMLTHRNLMSCVQAAQQALDLTSSDSALLVLPLHHSFAFVVATVLPSFIGAAIVLENNLRRIPNRLQEHRPTVFFGVPALYELMYRNILARAESEGRLAQMQAWQARVRLVKRLTGINIGPLVFRSIHRELGGRLRFLISGAAALKLQTALDYFSLGLPLIQGWGMAEASSGVAVQRFSRARFLLTRHYERHAGSVGTPLAGVEVQLADMPEKDIFVGQQGEGEVLLRGPSIFQGYWKAEEASRAAFTDGWLRTGDLARIDRDGSIYLSGRAKYVIVLDSGEKVYPEEIEAQLEESELIAEVCVTERRSRDKTLVTAVIYPRQDAVLARAQERGLEASAASVEKLVAEDVARLGQGLAGYKRVSRIELSDAPLPQTTVRKVARGRLAEAYSFDFERWREAAKAT